MKKLLSVLLCLTLLCTVVAVPAAAAEEAGGRVVVSRRVEYLADGSYIVETISVPAVQVYSNTVSGSKSAARYNSNGQHLFTVTVTGSFTYDGSSAKATSAVGAFAAYASGVTLTGNNAYTSGASAIAWASASYQGSSFRQTVSLTCAPNGNLS